MADDWAEDTTRRAKAALIDTTVPNAARVLGYLYGGQDHFEADRRAARSLAAAAPGIEMIPPAVHAFQRRVLRYLVTEAGIRQFLDVGTGLPLVGGTHNVTQALASDSRVVYVDDDPMVLSHSRALLRSLPSGAVGYVDADVRATETITAGARATLDFRQPVAVLLLFTLAYVADTAEAAAAVSALAEALPSGSHVAVYHLASDLDSDLAAAVRQWNLLLPAQPLTLRSAPEVASLVRGLVPVPPGLAPVTDWRPDATGSRSGKTVPVHGIVARKP